MENPKPSPDSNVKSQEPTPGGNSADLSRRKIIDRREGGKAEESTAGDRRDTEDRRDSKTKLPINTSQAKPLTQLQKKVQQHRKKKLLAGCEACMGMNFDTLAMDDYPSNESVAQAKRDRDYWVVCVHGMYINIFIWLDWSSACDYCWDSMRCCVTRIYARLFAFATTIF